MKIEDCKEGAKVRWDYYGKSDCGIIVKHKGSIWVSDRKNSVWATWDSSNHECPINAELENLTLVEPPKQPERKYSKEKIVEYLTYAGYTGAVSLIMAELDDYFSADNEEERKAIKLLKSKGYTVQK